MLGNFPMLSQTNESKLDSNDVQSIAKNLITINPLKLYLYAANIMYYRSLSSNSSVGLGIQYYHIDPTSGFGFNFEYRISPKGKIPRRFLYSSQFNVFECRYT